MPTPDEVQQSILDALERLSETFGRQVELTEIATEAARKANKRKETTLDDEKEISTKLAKNYKFRLGLEEETNPKLKKVLDNRFSIEQRIVDEAKKNYGEEVFVSSQRNKLFREQLQQYSSGNLAFGGVITRFKDLDKQQQSQLITAATTQRKLKEEQEKFTQTVQKLANPGAAIGDMKGKFSTLGSALDAGKESMTKLFGGGMAANVSMELLAGAGKLVGAALEGAAKAALGMGKSLLNGERGMAVGAKATQTFTNSITGAVSAFGSLLMGIGGVMIVLAPFTLGISALAGAGLMAAGGVLKLGAAAADVAADLNLMAAELNDKLYAGFRELGKASMTGAAGMEGVINNLHKMGLTVAEFDKFSKVIAENSKEMKMFGATAEKGVNRFAEVAGDLYKSEMGKTLELMGISAEDQYEHTAKYLALQARLGLLQDKNAQQLAKSTKSYVEELDKIAELTGATRKEQEDARNAVMAIEELRAGIMEEKRKADAGDPQAKKRLEEMEKALQVAAALQARGMTRQATGAAQYFGSGGAVMSTESAEFYSGQQKLIKDIRAGNKGVAQLSVEALQATVDNARKLAAVRRVGGSTEGTAFGDKYAAAGDTEAFLEGFNKEKIKEKAKVEKAGGVFNEDKFFEEYAKRMLEERKATDKSTMQNVDNSRKQMEVALKLDDAVFQYNKSVGINKIATDLFKKAVDLFAAAAGYKEKPPEIKPGAESKAAQETNAQRTLAKPLQDRVDILNKQIEEDEKALRDAKRSGLFGDKLKPLEDKILKDKTEYAKVAEELIVQEKKIKEAALKEKEIRLKQSHDKVELGRLQTANERDVNKLGDLNEKKANLTKAGKSTASVDKDIAETTAGITGRTGKINTLQGSLAPAPSTRGVTAKSAGADAAQEDVANLIKFGGESGSENHYLGLRPDVIDNFEKMISEYGKPVQINSAYRSFEEQKKQWDNRGSNSNKVARPGTSRHESGKALDLNSSDVAALKTLGLLDKYGFNTIDGDPPHIQMAKTGGLFSGPTSGYQVELHGREAVVPLPNPGAMLSSSSGDVQKDPLSSVMAPSAPPQAGNDNGVLMDLFQMIAEKMDKVGDYLNLGNDIQGEILKYSRV